MRLPTRIIVAGVMAALLAGVAVTVVSASAPWSSDCPNTAGSNKLCIYRDKDFLGARGNMAGSNSSYSGETYPSSSYAVNDSISAVKNLYSSRDVTWHHEPLQGGAGFCVDSNVVVSWVGLFSNDAFSSHQVASDDGAC